MKITPTMQGWKVLDRSRSSCRTTFWVYCSSRTDFELYYHPNGEVFPKVKGSKLFFFKNREDADNFASEYDIVVPCIAKNASKATFIAYSQDNVHSFWNRKLGKKRFSDISEKPPQGSYWADSITCLQ